MCGHLCCNAPQFRRHVLIHHGEYRYKCFECPKTFRPVDSFKNHIKEHERQKKIVEFEKKRADRIAAGLPEIDPDDLEQMPEPVLKRNKKAPAEFVTLDLCGKESRGERFHAKHMYTQHGMEMKMDCTDCGRTCASVRDLENHRRQEHCVASCHLCGKPFFSQNHLSVHLKQVHDIGQKEDEYICEMCARSFPTKAYLKIHMRTHNDKHIKCTLCTKMFRWESALKSHLAAAHAQTAGLFNCEFCGKQLKDKSNLKSHRYTHLDVKPHSCSKCGRGFIRRDMMLTHEKNCRL
jgi:KRAB domain-containing zinc finger protein